MKSSNSRLLRFEKDSILFRQGDSSREMYILRSGSVRIEIEKAGKTFTIANLGPGCYVGEMSFISGIPRSANAVVTEPSIVSVISLETLTEDRKDLLDWIVCIAKVLAMRIRKTTSLLGEYLEENLDITSRESFEHSLFSNLSITDAKDERSGRLLLKGTLSASGAEQIKLKIREYQHKGLDKIVLDFSDVIDIDGEGIQFLHGLVNSGQAKQDQIVIENVQLIRNKIFAIRGIESILASTSLPLKRVEAGEMLIKQGDIENTMYVIQSGEFSVYRSSFGKDIDLEKAQKGYVIGEMALLKEGKRSASVKAEKTGYVYVIDIQEFYKNLYNVPNWFMKLIQSMVQRLRRTNEMLDSAVKKKEQVKLSQHMPAPMGFIIDSQQPGTFLLQGNVSVDNVKYLEILVQAILLQDTKAIVVDVGRIKSIDKKGIAALYRLQTLVESSDGRFSITGMKDDMKQLFKPLFRSLVESNHE